MTAKETPGRLLSHYAWFRDYCEPAADVIDAKVAALFPKLPGALVRAIRGGTTGHALRVALIGAKENWQRPSEVVAMADAFDPLTYDFDRLAARLSPAEVETLKRVQRVARGGVGGKAGRGGEE